MGELQGRGSELWFGDLRWRFGECRGRRVSRERSGFSASAPPLLGGLIWREILCFALCLSDSTWVLAVAVVGMTFLKGRERERERERGVVGVVTFEIWVLFFLSEF